MAAMMPFGARAYTIDHVEFLAQAGFDFAEIDWKDPHVVAGELPQLLTLQERYGIAYLAHGPNERDPFDLDDLVEGLGPAVVQLLDMAPALGVTLYTQHLWLDPRFVAPEVIAGKLDLLERWQERARRVGVALCLENMSERPADFAPAFRRLPELGMTLDVGHGQILSRSNTSFGYVTQFRDRIRHVHLHDNHGGAGVRDDLHLPIGQGCVDFAGILAALRAASYTGGFSLEVGLEHVVAGREALRQIWEGATPP
jgi:sugar phosphate isomerase/epimerase